MNISSWRSIFLILTFVISALALQGCGTVFHGTSQEVFLNTSPPGANAKVGDQECVTPCTLNISRNSRAVKFSLNNTEKEYPIDYSINWGTSVIMGIYPGLLVSGIVDFISGGAYTLKSVNKSLKGIETVAGGGKLPANSDVDQLPSEKRSGQKDAYAIVVGIEQYRQKLPAADYAVNDAQAVTNYLTKVLGYPEENVITLLNDRASKSDFEKYFEKWLGNNVESNSEVFIYFSGHGSPDPRSGSAYLVPYDGDPAFIDQTGYSLKRMYESLGKLQAKQVVVALDSCFSGAGGRSVLAKGARPMVMSSKETVPVGRNISIMSASSGEQISSSYDEKQHGLFTYYLLKGIKSQNILNADGSIKTKELFAYLKPQVEKVARKSYNNEQVPQLLEDTKKN